MPWHFNTNYAFQTSSECVCDVSISLSCTVFHKIKNCIQDKHIIQYKIKQNGVTITLPEVNFIPPVEGGVAVNLLDPIIPLQFQVNLNLSRCEGIMNIASQQTFHKANFQLTYSQY